MNNAITTCEQETSVLIVGGSVVGLSTALFLAERNIPSLLVERHLDTSIHVRAGVFNTRTMELFRQVGLETAIFQQETPPSDLGEMGAHVESLTGKVLDTSEMSTSRQHQIVDPFASPTRTAMVGQDRVEPILRARAAALGSDLRFGTEMLTFEQNDQGVIAQIRERSTGKISSIRARYLVAADGNRSTIRQQCGIETYGYGLLGHWVSIVFRTDLREVLHDRRISLCFVNNATVEGIMGQSGERWSLLANIRLREDEQPDMLSEERCLELVRAAIGIPDQPIEIVSTLYWELAARVATNYQQGRVLLAGDAAHVMTTMGGFGANTGIADAHNLAWKLAAVLKGQASPDLLATYHAERQMAANLAVAFSVWLYGYRLPNLSNREAILRSAEEVIARVRKHADGPPPTPFSVVHGYRYCSAAVISEDEDDGVYFENQPSGRPGTRAPHVWLERAGSRLSVLDLYGRDFVLLTGPDGSCWREAASRVTEKLGVKLAVHTIGPDEVYRDRDRVFLSTYSIGESGAVLVRPDGFIAWKAEDAAGQEERLERVMAQILCR
jgi:putative polyketide hydroxylase